MRRSLPLIPLLAATCAMGVETSPSGGLQGYEVAPGPRFGGSNRTVVIRGMMDLDVVNRGGYLSANGDVSDHEGYGNIRAELGAKVKPDETVGVNITFAYEAEAGDNTADDPEGKARAGFAVVDDAFVELRDFLGFASFGAKLGRMPVGWNLRSGHGAFLYDSAANHPKVTSWDGAQASFTGFEHFQINPFAYSLPGASTLYGVEANWEPAQSGDRRSFLTAMATWERQSPVYLPDVAKSQAEGKAMFTQVDKLSRLVTYYLGGEFQAGDADLFAEGAAQRGDGMGGQSAEGYGLSLGFDWHFNSPRITIGMQGDYLTGDNPTTDVDEAFHNSWEGMRDTYIVEDEQYGELSRYMVGDLMDVKLKAGVVFDDRGKVALDTIYGFYRNTVGANRDFGQEADLTLTWKYSYAAVFRFLGGVFLPDDGFIQRAPGLTPSDDLVYLLGANLTVSF